MSIVGIEKKTTTDQNQRDMSFNLNDSREIHQTYNQGGETFIYGMPLRLRIRVRNDSGRLNGVDGSAVIRVTADNPKENKNQTKDKTSPR